jgi:hypothetical protein
MSMACSRSSALSWRCFAISMCRSVAMLNFLILKPFVFRGVQ